MTAAGGLALACAVCGLGLALGHPLWPGAAAVFFLAVLAWTARRPAHLLLALPAALPWLDFSPWTGRLAFNEFDLLVLASAAGAHARGAWDGWTGRDHPVDPAAGTPAAWGPLARGAAAVLVACSGVALWRGLVDAGGGPFTRWPGYADATHTLLQFKPLLWLLLLSQPVRRLLRQAPMRQADAVCRGMCLGAASVVLAVLWERAAMTGLLDFSRPYRAVGLFWEMHVGGAAIDAYLALAAPFVGWGLHRARSPGRFAAMALLALGFAYACLTTFSRGVYGAVVLPMAAMGWLLWAGARERETGSPPWRPMATRGLAVALAMEVLAVAGLGNFLVDRVRQTEQDFGRRLVHWGQGLGLLQGPADLALGIGLGRLPSHLSRFAPGHEFPGAVELPTPPGDRPQVRLSGPATWTQVAGLYALTQRVPLVAGAVHRVAFDASVDRPLRLSLRLCEMHLLYPRRCQWGVLPLGAAPGWQHHDIALTGPPLQPGAWWAPRQAVLLLSVLEAGGTVRLTRLALSAGDGPSLLRNGGFDQGLDHWLPLAQRYFLPWHIDNLYLELLIERGPLALLAFLLLALPTLGRVGVGALASAQGQASVLALGASVAGLLLVGLVSSVLDTGRPAFLALGLLALAAALAPGRHRAGPGPGAGPPA